MAAYDDSQYTLTNLRNAPQESEFTQLTPAQRQSGRMEVESDLDQSQTSVKKIYVSTYERIAVTPENHDRLFNEICGSPPTDYNWPLIDKVKNIFRTSTRADFISKIIVEFDSREDRLDEVRSTIYNTCLSLTDYPLPKDAELKRRKKTRNGEKIYNKLANDIYVLVSVIENQSYDEMKDVVNLPKNNTFRDMNSTLLDSNNLATCIQEMSLLKDKLCKYEGDIIALKQEHENYKKSLKVELKTITDNMQQLNDNIFKELRDIRTNIERVEGEKTSGIVSVKNALKRVTDHCNNTKDELFQDIKGVREKITNVDRKIDKQISKIDSKVSNLNKLCNKDKSETKELPRKDTSPGTKSVNDISEIQSKSYSDVLTGNQTFHNDKPVQTFDPSVLSQTITTHSTANDHMTREESGQSQLARDTSNNCVDSYPTNHIRHDYSDHRVLQIPTLTSAQTIPTIISDRNCNNNLNGALNRRDDAYSNKNRRAANCDEHTGVASKDANYMSRDINQYDVNDDDFSESLIKKTKRFYLGGFKSSVKTQKLINYVTNRGIKVTMLRVFGQNSGKPITLRINVESKNSQKLLEPGFWPRGVICKPWLTKNQLRKKWSQSDETEKLSINDDDITEDIAYTVRKRTTRYNYKSSKTDRGSYSRHHTYDQNHGDNDDYRRPQHRSGRDYGKNAVDDYGPRSDYNYADQNIFEY